MRFEEHRRVVLLAAAVALVGTAACDADRTSTPVAPEPLELVRAEPRHSTREGAVAALAKDIEWLKAIAGRWASRQESSQGSTYAIENLEKVNRAISELESIQKQLGYDSASEVLDVFAMYNGWYGSSYVYPGGEIPYVRPVYWHAYTSCWSCELQRTSTGGFVTRTLSSPEGGFQSWSDTFSAPATQSSATWEYWIGGNLHTATIYVSHWVHSPTLTDTMNSGDAAGV